MTTFLKQFVNYLYIFNDLSVGVHFYEEVEDTKDSVWVVQVTANERPTFMKTDDWFQLTRRLAKFGVRTGIFNCDLDYR